ncbi:MAG: DUF2974 domain-containing protein [Clostridia bacterium]|nr:DUF2974 domain-containing protein [Clostridia bacterium]
MGDLVSYIGERGGVDLLRRPFGEVDSLVLAQLSYLNFKPCGHCAAPCDKTLRGLLHGCYDESFLENTWEPQRNDQLLRAAADSVRFGGVRISGFVNAVSPEEQKQFSAITFHLPGNRLYLAYRGTDATLVGWKEDFNMTLVSHIPAQRQALSYLEETARRFPHHRLILGGHSTGGNIAVYAAIMASAALRQRIAAVYDHDGPGFQPELLRQSAYYEMLPRIHKTIPQSAIIGLMMAQEARYRVVDCRHFGPFQHDPYTWKVEGDHFVTVEEVDGLSRHFNRSINTFLRETDPETRRLFVDTVYEFFSATRAETVYDLLKNWYTTLPALLEAVRTTDPTVLAMLKETLRQLARSFAVDETARAEERARVKEQAAEFGQWLKGLLEEERK